MNITNTRNKNPYIFIESFTETDEEIDKLNLIQMTVLSVILGI